MIPCSGFIEEVLSVDADADADADGTNSARISHPPPFRRVTKNYPECALDREILYRVNI